jgi:hypothetical protein
LTPGGQLDGRDLEDAAAAGAGHNPYPVHGDRKKQIITPGVDSIRFYFGQKSFK